jgi:CubicO group peptidase (beta-lactamase class C family)
MLLNRRTFCLSALPGLLGAETKDSPDRLARDALKVWEVPGVAVGVVRDDRIEYLAGHGVKAEGEGAAVTPQTLFPLGSCTKGFTTAALAMLVEQGKLRWDDPVRKHVPFFRLSDALADRRVTLRDLLCHRTGLGTHDLFWYRSAWKPEEAVRRAAFLPLSHPFRSAFQYQSTMFTAAGLAVESASGMSWGDFVKKHYFDPLGMKTAGCSTAAYHTEDRATGHKPAPLKDWHPSPNPDAAISIHASAEDVCHWLRFQLKEKSLEETHTPQTVVPMKEGERRLHPETVQTSYGLGWVVQDYRGWNLVAHAGVLDGFRVQLTMVPRAKLGLVVLANLHGTRMNLALSYRLLDHYLKLEPRDWNAVVGKEVKRQEAEAEKARRERLARRHLDTQPSHRLASYIGTYDHPAYGPMRLSLERGRLACRWGSFSGPLEHFHHDTFHARGEHIGEVELTFALDALGAVREAEAGIPFGVSFARKKESP